MVTITTSVKNMVASGNVNKNGLSLMVVYLYDDHTQIHTNKYVH